MKRASNGGQVPDASGAAVPSLSLQLEAPQRVTLTGNLNCVSATWASRATFRTLNGKAGWPDWILLVALVSSTVPFVVFWTVAPSWPRDLNCAALLLVGSLVSRDGAASKTVQRLIWTFAGACLLGLLVWTVTLGSKLSLNFWSGWSPWLLSGSMLVFAAAHGRSRWPAWKTILVGYATILAVIQALGILAVLSRVITPDTSDDGSFYGFRPLHASLALLILVSFILVVTSEITERWQTALAIFLGLSVVVSQHRSVWVAMITATALLGLAMWRGQYRSGALPLAVSVGYMALSTVLPAFSSLRLLPSASNESNPDGLADVVTSSHTLEWRVEMWRSRIEAPRGLIHWLFGGVLSVNPVKWPGAGVMNPFNTAHSMAVDVLVMFGIVGLCLVTALFGIAVLGRRDRLAPVAICLWAVLGYGFFYYWPSWVWILIGTALVTRTVGHSQPQLTTVREPQSLPEAQ